MNKNALITIIIILLVVAGMFGLAVWLKSISPALIQANPDIKGDKVFSRDYSHMTGTASAKVVVVEFGDFECPFCAQAYDPVKQVVDKYQANANFSFVFRNFPLAQHSNALSAAEAAEAAGAQGKYWEMEGLLYQRQNDWAGVIDPTGNYVNYAQQIGLDVNKFKTEVSTGKYIDNITQDQKDGDALGVNSTPTFFINGQKLDSYTQLDSQISVLLAK